MRLRGLHDIIGPGAPWNDHNLIDIVCDGKVYYVPMLHLRNGGEALSYRERLFARRVLIALTHAYLG